MREILDYCTGGVQRNVSAGAFVVHEGHTTGHLYVLIEGRLEVIKGDTVVATITEPGAVLGEMSPTQVSPGSDRQSDPRM
jgi:CRP/FNR family cyclic AMP-dependent transcriptional regulator